MEVNIVSTIQQPEYTGENRCTPCTVLNVAIATVGSLAVSRKSKIWGAIALTLSLALIYLRGYLVPGTPTLTKQYLPPEVLQWFGKEPEEPPVMSGLGTGGNQQDTESAKITIEESESTSNENSVESDEAEVQELDPEAYFLELGILEPCEDEDDLCLTDEFSENWSEQIDQFDDGDVSAEQATKAFGFDTTKDKYNIEVHDDARVLAQDSELIGQWPSQAALVTDLGAAAVLETIDSQWNEYTPTQKGQLLNSLRLFFEVCPGDSGTVEFNEETVESCCQSHDVLAVSCSDSGERLFEYPLDEIEA